MKAKLLVLGLFCLAIVSGCTDKLGKVDFSGRVELEPESGGWAYRNIASASIRPIKVDSDDRLGNYRNDLELQKTITIGKGEYLIATRFKTNRIRTGHDILDIFLKSDLFTLFGDYQIFVYNFDTKERVKTIIAKDSEFGDDWDSLIDDPRANFNKRNLERKGDFVQYFREPVTERDCVIEIGYEIKSEALRTINNDGEFIEDDGEYKYEELSVDGSAWINVGFRQCLTGKHGVGDQRIQFYILDWNLNGEFDEEDRAWSDYTNKIYEFGEEIRLTDSWSAKKDNTYRLTLIKPQSKQEKYALEIELVNKAKK
ncbi:MAG: hypothetical protein GXY86_09885 [Firmicutes bacterium]|nr:hypothetical protein [Bacillota bacterium]